DRFLAGARNDQAAIGAEQVCARFALDLPPDLMRAYRQGCVVPALTDREPRDARAAMRGAPVMRRREPVDPEHACTMLRQLTRGCAPDRAEAYGDRVVCTHCASGGCARHRMAQVPGESFAHEVDEVVAIEPLDGPRRRVRKRIPEAL